jgi:hypothetical protein
MRSLTLLAAVTLAFAAVTLVPAAEASDPCGAVGRATGVYACALDPCAFQSDCCGGWTDFWCPEDQ